MRILGWTGSFMLSLALVGCGAANSLDDETAESGTYVAPPKIEFAKRKPASKSSTKSTAPATGTTSATATPGE